LTITAQLCRDITTAAASICDAFVDKTVTVVIDLVTDLLPGFTAHGQAALVDVTITVFIDPIAAEFRFWDASWGAVFVNASITVIIDGVVTTLGLGDTIIRAAAFIDLPIAVVVDAVVTHFLICRQNLSFAGPPSLIDAVSQPTSAEPTTGRVRRAFIARLVLSPVAGESSSMEAPFVDFPVAVVIDPVAVASRTA